MSRIEPTSIDRHEFSDLRVVLRDKRPDAKRKGYMRIEGIHPKCGGYCTIASEWGDDKPRQYSVIKPHSKCDPVACLDSRPVCSGSAIPLINIMLDCNKVAS